MTDKWDIGNISVPKPQTLSTMQVEDPSKNPTALKHTDINSDSNDSDKDSASKSLFQRFLSNTIGSASIYLKKPQLPPISEYESLWRRRGVAQHLGNHAPVNADGQGIGANLNNRAVSPPDYDENNGEVRVMRRLLLFRKYAMRPGFLDFGIGCCLKMQNLRLEPVARVKLGSTITISGLPHPVFKFAYTLPFNWQGMQARVRYEVPIPCEMENLLRPPARMLIQFEHASNSGCHFYPGGIEFGEHTFRLGNTRNVLKCAAGLNFPKEFPMDPHEYSMFEIKRLGIKTEW